MIRLMIAPALLMVSVSALLADAAPQIAELTEALRKLPSQVLPEQQRGTVSKMVEDDLDRRLRSANQQSTAEWRRIQSRDDWERFCDSKLDALQRSLGQFPPAAAKPPVRVTGTLAGEGYSIENLLFESRPGLWVTANLYQPATPKPSMPGILLCHSHHNPKEQGELQEMGMAWARQGCLVLVMDQLGHGERRQHPFRTAADYARPFAVGRQDYYFRYDVGIQLHLAGESLIGWMARDLMRGVDVLLARPGIDPQRIALLGAVAGGGDPAAVAGALDRRIRAVVPLNFGGPQPESRYPLPDDAEESFHYAGGGGWESTRNLRCSAADGFLPWVIVGGIAPRGLIYGHEFSWDRPRDPVWKRLEQIYTWYGAADRLAFAHGRGLLRGKPPEASHCNNIGRVHRAMIHPVFKRWFDIAMTPDDEAQPRHDAEKLHCITPEAEAQLRPQRLCDLLPRLAAERLAVGRRAVEGKSPAERGQQLRLQWSTVLGNVVPADVPKVSSRTSGPETVAGVRVERIALSVEPGIVIPLMLLLPKKESARLPVVVAVAQAGKEAFLRERSAEIAALLSGGVAVCLPDVRGTGETKADRGRDAWSTDTALSSTELMLGGTMVGARLRDLRAVLKHLRGQEQIDPRRIALWGDSLTAVNPPQADFRVPHRADGRPAQSEPLGGLLALLGALYEEDICAVYVRGGLSEFAAVLHNQFVYIPHDVVVPGVLTAGDLCDLAAALAPRPLCLCELVDHLNHRLSEKEARTVYHAALAYYQDHGAAAQIAVHPPAANPARWLLERLGSR